MTARVYPEHAARGSSSSHLYVFNNGSDAVRVPKLEAWELATASINVAPEEEEEEEEEDGLAASSNMCTSSVY